MNCLNQDFYDLKQYQAKFSNFTLDSSGEKAVVWLGGESSPDAIKVMRTSSVKPYILQTKMEYTQKEFVDINTLQKGRKRIKLSDAALIPSSLHPAYSSSVKISSSKYNDLIKLIDDEVVPERYREIYEKIPH